MNSVGMHIKKHKEDYLVRLLYKNVDIKKISTFNKLRGVKYFYSNYI